WMLCLTDDSAPTTVVADLWYDASLHAGGFDQWLIDGPFLGATLSEFDPGRVLIFTGYYNSDIQIVNGARTNLGPTTSQVQNLIRVVPDHGISHNNTGQGKRQLICRLDYNYQPPEKTGFYVFTFVTDLDSINETENWNELGRARVAPYVEDPADAATPSFA